MITDIYLHTADGLTPTALRGLSLSRLEAELNVATSPHPTVASAEIPTLAAIYDAASPEADGTPEPTLAQLRARTPDRGAPARPPRSRLTRPEVTGPDEFYVSVAAAYAEHAPRTRAPAKKIASEAGVPITTAHRWIREARRRGFLPPAQRGKAG
ncbi:MAG: hypothetical protein ACRDSR_11220 [Pseudonocardiaceae bacterium]